MAEEKDEKTFEQSLNELEKIATDLERGDLSLEEAIEKIENGMKLSKECSEKLDKAEKRINILVQSEDDDLKEEKFEVE